MRACAAGVCRTGIRQALEVLAACHWLIRRSVCECQEEGRAMRHHNTHQLEMSVWACTSTACGVCLCVCVCVCLCLCVCLCVCVCVCICVSVCVCVCHPSLI